MVSNTPELTREQIIKALGQKVKDLLSDLDDVSKKLNNEENKNEKSSLSGNKERDKRIN